MTGPVTWAEIIWARKPGPLYLDLHSIIPKAQRNPPRLVGLSPSSPPPTPQRRQLSLSLSHVGDLELLFFSPWNPLFQSAL
jgi:hypothetical protein